jgi:hypothetical protein
MTESKLKIILIFGIGFRFIYKNPGMLDAWLNCWSNTAPAELCPTKTAYGVE